MPKTPLTTWNKQHSSEVMDYVMEEMVGLATQFADHKDGCKQEDVIQAVNICAAKIDKLTVAIKALAAKLDAEDVTNLDKTYASSVQTVLN